MSMWHDMLLVIRSTLSYSAVFSFLAGACLNVCCFSGAWGVGGPLAHIPASYAGCGEQDGYRYKTELHLYGDAIFSLSESLLLLNGKVSQWTVTGRWHRVRGGNFLQLANDNGFCRVLTVGSEENLYQTIQLPSRNHLLISLRCTGGPPPVQHERGEKMPRREALWRSNPEDRFSAFVRYGRYVASFMEKGKHIGYGRLIISPVGRKHEGTMEMFDGSIHLNGTYKVERDAIRLSFDRDSPLGKRLESIKIWKIYGEVMELWSDNVLVAVLEKLP